MNPRFTVILGGDLLVFGVCEELLATGGRVVVIADSSDDVAAAVTTLGAQFVARRGDERDALASAGVRDASVAMALTEDDHTNLQFALAARDLNPGIRVVMRQFNRTLGRKIEDQLPNCAVISLSSLSAAVYAAAALDPACFYGVEFPYVDGRLVGFARLSAGDAGVAGLSAHDAERRLDARIVSRDGAVAFDRAEPLDASDTLTLFSAVRSRRGSRARALARRVAETGRRLRGLGFRNVRPNPVVTGAFLAGLAVFTCGTAFFATTMRRDVATAAYFVLSTMTTTGYGDITPKIGDVPSEVGAMLLMLAGLTFSGIFIAVLSSRFIEAQYVVTQGLRRVSRRDHIVVCGAGNVGSRVIDYLLQNHAKVVVVETTPRPEMIERARAGDFDLLTGDASKDRTLDFCNVAEAATVVAITNSDTMNLEVALGTRARNADAAVVMRVQHLDFETSIRKHFNVGRVFGTAAIAAPVLAGLAYDAGVRGRLETDAGTFAIVQRRVPASGVLPAAESDGLTLAVWRDGHAVMLDDVRQARAGEEVLFVAPVVRATSRQG